jgi:hypothetical protein
MVKSGKKYSKSYDGGEVDGLTRKPRFNPKEFS